MHRSAQRVLRLGVALLLVACTLVAQRPATHVARAALAPLSQDDVVYMLLTDRYPDGDPSNTNFNDGATISGNLKFYQGGDWQGVINKMSYIKSLGVTAIWISPVSMQEPLSRDHQEASYHGYFTHDYYQPNPHFGTTAKLQELVSTAHNNGIKVCLDAVPNHTADYLKPYATSYDSTTYQPAAPFNNPSWYHHNGDITDYNNQTQVETSDLGGLDDLAQENSAVASELENVYRTWVNTASFDCVRVDAARSMPKTFLKALEQAVGVPTFGEIFQGDPTYVSDYQNYEWSVLDFPLFFTARDAFASDSDLTAVGNILAQDSKYPNPNRLITFLDNHDRDRFLTRADDNFQRLRVALTFLFSVRGIPDVYYGTEQAYYGNGVGQEYQGIANNYNREVLKDYNQNNPIFQYIQRLTAIRKQYAPLRQGTQREMWKDPTVYAFSRRVDSTGDETITGVTNSWNTQTRTIPLRAESSIPVGAMLTNVLNTADTLTVQAGGTTGKQITMTLGEHEGKIYVAGTPASYTPPARNITRIRIHYNVGLGNNITMRGDTYPLWWDRDRGTRNIASDVWEWDMERIPAGQSFQFKPLINGTTYSCGNNYVGTGGQTIDIYPTFC